MFARSNYDATKGNKSNPHFRQSMETRGQNEDIKGKVGRNKEYYRANKGGTVIKWLDEEKEAVLALVQVAIASA